MSESECGAASAGITPWLCQLARGHRGNHLARIAKGNEPSGHSVVEWVPFPIHVGQAMKPTIGRIVHYQAYGTPGGEYPSVPRAAVVTEVDADGSTVGLCVLNPTGQFFNRGVRYDADGKPGCWRWPPRE